MLRGIYAAATGMDAAANAHENVARNLAHASVPGFRRTVIPFAVLERDPAELEPGTHESLGVTYGQPVVDFTSGPLEQTGNPLDVALNGDGFFTVEGPSGPLYTRNGSFHLDATGRLVTSDGLAVQGDQGAITVPPDVALSEVQISPDGTVRAGTEELGKLAIVNFTDPQSLTAVGATLFEASPDAASNASQAVVVQGAREMSNVSPVSELVAMITAQRHYEAAQRAISTLDRAMQKRVDGG